MSQIYYFCALLLLSLVNSLSMFTTGLTSTLLNFKYVFGLCKVCHCTLTRHLYLLHVGAPSIPGLHTTAAVVQVCPKVVQEAFVTYFKVYIGIRLDGLRQTTKNMGIVGVLIDI
jgi:hypothetical protein